MLLKIGDVRGMYRKFKPHLLMVLTQLGYTFLYFITEASFNQGLNPHVYITYRHAVSGFVMLPFAYFLERKTRPRLTWALFVELFILSLLGLEKLDVKNPRGKAKVIGTLASLAGVTLMTLYKGKSFRSLWSAPIHMESNLIHKNWLKGSVLGVASCITWSMWYVMQAFTLKKYPAQLSLTTWMSFIGGAQSAVFTACVEHKPTAWIIGFDIKLWSILYGGIVCSGLIIFIQLWCTEEKGPVFVTVFNPLSTIMVALLAYFVLGERLYTGSLLGGIIVIISLYLFLWGKQNEERIPMRSSDISGFACENEKQVSQDMLRNCDEESVTAKSIPQA
ncbi:WAT1-related protein At4g08290-like isoform X2 [Dioscorea cayenensis subsp. rotundata]|uniref:WAT1-related protein n=1 Tax=Dioscorea cayennensis subsp. rotundata TaxID=55577 RepID=A0AB40C0Q9_DIOCR|nr:WAT1-related protein At4g08290-like isoform X2 [Dioscorea cayenensis subsp. rotundata]